jgi:hypothetical protein
MLMGYSVSQIILFLAVTVHAVGWLYYYLDVLRAGKCSPSIRSMVKVFIATSIWPLLVLGRWLITSYFLLWFIKNISREDRK